MTMTIERPSPPTQSNPMAAGWIPQSPLEWLEELRDEHERLATARRFAAMATAKVRRAQADLRAEHDSAVAEAARAGADPPPLPGRLDPAYMTAQLEAAADAEAAALAELKDCVARVGRAVGQYRRGDEWRAVATVGDDAGRNDPRVAVAARLRAFEAHWTWPVPREPGPSLEEVAAEVAAATAELGRLTDEADARIVAWRVELEAATAAGAERPPFPDLYDDSMIKRTHAETRLQRALAARDAAVRRSGVIA